MFGRNCVFLTACFATVVVVNGLVKVGERGLPAEKLTFKTPVLTEEDQHSNFLPDNIKCDACRAIAYQLHKKFGEFKALNKQYKSKLPESEVIELVESICSHTTFHEYGIKEVNGVKKLTGSGLKSDEPGVISGGGKWPGRLHQLCVTYSEELGEDGLYEMYEKDPEHVETLEKQLCYGKGRLGECNKKNHPPSSSEKKRNSRVDPSDEL